MSTDPVLPKTMKAMVLKSTSQPPTIESVPTPQAVMGSAVVRILATGVVSYSRDVYTGKRNYPFPLPMTPGFSAIGRVAAVGVDATKLKPGDLVFVDGLIRSRDEPTDAILPGVHEGHSDGSRKLMRDAWRDWTWAEYCRAPLEGLTLLNEHHLMSELGYSVSELTYIASLLVPYGGLRAIDLQAGQTIIVAPATGPFGGAAVLIALAMGARVIAMGRNKTVLEALKTTVPTPERLVTVAITGDVQSEVMELKKHGQIDAFFDIGPPEAAKSSHVKSGILALRPGGKVSLMSGYREEVSLPLGAIMHQNLRIYGKYMYERSDIADMVKLIDCGLLKLGKDGGSEVVGEYSLEQYQDACDAAAASNTMGKIVVIKP